MFVSAARQGDAAATEWVARQSRDSLFLSVITLGEISRGIAMKHRTDPVAANSLSIWLRGLRQNFADHILDIDGRIAVGSGRTAATRTRGGAEGLIAATAAVHDLTVVTRNVLDFVGAGVAVLDPWQA